MQGGGSHVFVRNPDDFCRFYVKSHWGIDEVPRLITAGE
jgi:hypothetical protein